MARLLLAVFGWCLDVDLNRLPDTDDTDGELQEVEEVEERGSTTSYPVGFTTPGGFPYDVDVPDRS